MLGLVVWPCANVLRLTRLLVRSASRIAFRIIDVPIFDILKKLPCSTGSTIALDQTGTRLCEICFWPSATNFSLAPDVSFRAKRKWAGRQSSLAPSKMTHNGPQRSDNGDANVKRVGP